MTDTPRITRESVSRARETLIEQGRKPSQRAVIKLLGGGSFSDVRPLLRELAAEAGDVPGSALTDPLTTTIGEAVESVWRELGKEADRVVSDARQQFERDLKAEQGARTQAEAAATRTLDTLQDTQAAVAKAEKALSLERATVERIRAELEHERLAHAKTETRLEAAETLSEERKTLRDEAIAERDQHRVEWDQRRQQTDRQINQLQTELSEQRQAHDRRCEALNEKLSQARTSVSTQQSQLDTLYRENTNLTTINTGLSARIEKTQAALATEKGEVKALSALRSADQDALIALRSSTRAQLTDKDQLISTLQAQSAKAATQASNKKKRQ